MEGSGVLGLRNSAGTDRNSAGTNDSRISTNRIGVGTCGNRRWGRRVD